MEEQEVLRLFGLFTGLSEEEAAGWAVLCRSTIAELTGRLRPGVDPASDANRERLSAAAAAMAAYRYRLLGAGQTPDSLKVGEITLTSGGSSGGIGAAAALQQEYLAAVRELVDAVTASKAKIAELEACKSAKDDAAEPVSGEKACPICGAVSDSKFCPHCGAPMGD